MAFKSNVLSTSMDKNSMYGDYGQTENVSSLGEMTVKEHRPYLYSVLEFNDEMHTIELSDKMAYYRAMVEAATGDPTKMNAIYEGYVESAIKKIGEMIARFIEFVTEKFNEMFEINYLVQMQFNRQKRLSYDFTKGVKDQNKEYTFTIFNYPNFHDIKNNLCDKPLEDIFKAIDDICDGKDQPEATDTTLKTAFYELSKAIEHNVTESGASEYKREYMGKPEDSVSFRKFITNNVVFTDRVSKPYHEWAKASCNVLSPLNRSAINEKMNYINGKLSDIKKKVENVTTADELQRSNLSKYLDQARTIINAYQWFLRATINSRRAQMRDIMRVYKRISSGEENGTVNESGFIHGEEFNADTLFDNEDIRDFNRTEWLDLQLEAECYELSYRLNENYRSAALKEAVIRTSQDEDKFQKILELDTSAIKKTEVIIREILENMRRLIDQAIAKMLEAIHWDSAFLNTNKDKMAQPFKIKVTSTSDLFAAAGRLRDPVNPKPFNYESMKEDLKDVNTFFIKHILPELERAPARGKRVIKWNDGMAPSHYLNCYYGGPAFKGVEPEKIEYSSQELESNKSAMMSYMQNPRSLVASIRAEMGALENNARRIANSMKTKGDVGTEKPVSPNQPKQLTSGEAAPENKEQTPQNASAYSFLYGMWFNEAEVEVLDADGKEVPGAKAEAFVAENTALKNYISAYRMVYTAKVNGAKTILKEYGQILREHCKSYGAKEEKKEGQQQAANAKQPAGAPA